MAENEKDHITGVETTGHEWDGIRELDNPMPRWWLYTFYACIVWGLGYTIFYPAWPLVSSATGGVLGWTTRGEVADTIAQARQEQSVYTDRINELELAAIRDDSELFEFAYQGGRATYATFCSQCHGSGAQGALGYPNLNDDDWIWGGTVGEIYHTIAHGVRQEDDDESRYSFMPAFGVDGLLQRDEIRDVAAYVLSLSGLPHTEERAAAGATIYEENCASCHGDNGLGDPYQGAPNLADAIWLYGGTEDEVYAQIWNPKHGVMPDWDEMLDEATIKQVALYVHSLGGGQEEE